MNRRPMSSNVTPVINSWLDLTAENRGTDRFHLSYEAFRSILNGQAPTPDELASMTVLSSQDARALIDSMIDEGRLRLDQSGERVIGAGGLSVEPARQSLTIGDRTFGTWCALDAVGIPAGLGVDAFVEATCDDTGEPVRIEITAGRITRQSPDTLWVSLVPASVAMSVYTHL
jgi:alkylmercury lyase